MFGSTALEVVIGLTFIFFIFSLAASTICEFVETLTKTRGRNLERGIANLIGDGRASTNRQALEAFYNHPLIYALFRGNYRRGSSRLPSYIPPSHFARAALDIAHQLNQDSTVRRLLNTTMPTSGRTLIQEMEEHYDSAMERVSGWYRRRVQVILLAVGLVIAFAGNVNTFALVDALARSSAVREVVAAQASSFAENEANAGNSLSADQIAAQLGAIDLPWGWTAEAVAGAPRTTQPLTWTQIEWGWLAQTLLGCLLTALAIALGAPFWFDLLSKAVQLRTSLPERDPTPRRDGPPPTPTRAAEGAHVCGPGDDDGRPSNFVYG